MLGSEVIRTMIRPFIVFVALMVGVSALLQDSLIIYKLVDSYTHWAVILLGLPILIGILLRYLETKLPLLIILGASAISTLSMYYLYKTYFWAEAPTLMNALFLFAVIAGGAHLPYSRGPIAKLFSPLFSALKTQKKVVPNKKKVPTAKKTNTTNVPPPAYSRGTAIPMIEMTVGIASLVLSVYSIAFMGKA